MELRSQLAVGPEYADGYQIAQIPEELVVSPGHDEGAFRPTALDLTLAPEGVLNRDWNEPHGRTSPQVNGQVPIREIVMGPILLSELTRSPLVIK